MVNVWTFVAIRDRTIKEADVAYGGVMPSKYGLCCPNGDNIYRSAMSVRIRSRVGRFVLILGLDDAICQSVLNEPGLP